MLREATHVLELVATDVFGEAHDDEVEELVAHAEQAPPCPYCQTSISLSQYLSNISLALTCSGCQRKLHYKPWVWALTGLVLAVMAGVIYMIGLQNLLDNDHGERAVMRICFLGILIFALGLSAVSFALGPFAAPKK